MNKNNNYLSNLEKIENPSVIFSNGIGDHFLVLPVIRALSKLFNGNLTLICEKNSYAMDIFYNIEFKKIIGISFWEEASGRRFNSESLINEISECDFLISLNPWGEKLDIIHLINKLNLKDSIGFYNIFNNCIPFFLDKHNMDLNFDIAKSINPSLNIDDFTYPPLVGKNFNLLRNRFSEKIPQSVKILSLHTDTKDEKMWKKKSYLKVLEKLCKDHPYIGIVLVGEDNIEIGNSVIKDRILTFSEGVLPFRMACAIVSISNFFFGIDSVFLHVADFYRVPTLGLFGPTSHVEFGSKFSKNETIQSKNGKMDGITESEVSEALSDLITPFNF